MGIDAGIYSQLKPVEMPNYLDHATKAANLRSIGMNQERMGRQMQAEESEAKTMAHLKRASIFGNALESISGLPPQERASAYQQVYSGLVKDGVIRGEDAPPEYDDTFYRQSLSRFRQSKDYLDSALQKAQIAHLKAQDSKLYADTRSGVNEKSIERMAGKLGSSQDAARTVLDVEGQLGFSLDDYDPETNTYGAKVINGKKVGGTAVDLPGISLPMVGRVTAYDSKARTLNDTASRLFNLELKDRSGAAVTTPELERLRTEYSQGKFNKESELLNAMQRYKRNLFAKMKDIEASNPRAAARYADQGGTTSRVFGEQMRRMPMQPGAGSGPGFGLNNAHAGSEKPDFSGMSDADLEKYLGGK